MIIVMMGIRNHSHDSFSRVHFLACEATALTAPPAGDMSCVQRWVTMMPGILLIFRSMPPVSCCTTCVAACCTPPVAIVLTDSTEGMEGTDGMEGMDGIEGMEPSPALFATC